MIWKKNMEEGPSLIEKQTTSTTKHHLQWCRRTQPTVHLCMHQKHKRERERQTDRRTDRQTERKRNRQTDRQNVRAHTPHSSQSNDHPVEGPTTVRLSSSINGRNKSVSRGDRFTDQPTTFLQINRPVNRSVGIKLITE